MKKKKWRLLYKGNIDEFIPERDANDWKELSSEQKFRQVSALALQVLKLKGKRYEDVSRLLRTTAVLKRP